MWNDLFTPLKMGDFTHTLPYYPDKMSGSSSGITHLGIGIHG